MPYEIKISPEYDGVKPKNFLKKKLDLQYHELLKHLKNKRITLNKKKIKEDTILRKGDILKIWLDEIKLREISEAKHTKMQNMNIPVIFENENFIVLNKPADIIVQGAQDNQTSISLHLAYIQNKNKDYEDNFEYHHAHRIDKDTSGILVVAKQRNSLRILNKRFSDKNVIKKYLCLCLGKFKDKSGKIDIILKRNPQGIREKVSVGIETDDEARKTLSYYNVKEEFEHFNQTFSLVEVEIKTGYTHQIRVHMKYLGHPIIGDKMYGNSIINEEFTNILNRHFLHAKSIEFEYKEKQFKFEAELTKDLKNTLEFLRN
ncbi:MAG: RluA family pseudouridine synthase [Nanoarchaeota archaeon]|nr:RluA family pseudouridine synthase [Nanoarchaeota archaeon]